LEGKSASNPFAKVLAAPAIFSAADDPQSTKPFDLNHFTPASRVGPVCLQGEAKQWQQHQ
jgi:hypothetical protein